MTLQACNLISTTCCTNPVHAAVIRIMAQLQLHNQSSKTKWNICACLSRVLVRHIPWSLYSCCNTACCTNPVQPETTQNQEMAASRCNCTARVAQRSGIDVCLFRWVGPIKQMLQAVPGCDGMLHKPCAYGSIQKPADSGC
jgi:hypothetical protein